MNNHHKSHRKTRKTKPSNLYRLDSRVPNKPNAGDELIYFLNAAALVCALSVPVVIVMMLKYMVR